MDDIRVLVTVRESDNISYLRRVVRIVGKGGVYKDH